MGLLSLSGTLLGTPDAGGSTDTFPSASFREVLTMKDGVRKGYNYATGVLVRNLNSSVAFVTLPELGATGAVTKGLALYLKCIEAIEVRITTDDGVGGSVVAIIPLQGPMLLEFPDSKFLKLLEARGVAKLSYLVIGNE